MKKIVFLFALVALVMTGCTKVPISGRSQLNMVDDSQVLQSSLASYRGYMDTAKVSGNATQSAQVTRVGKRIAAATEAYLRANGYESEIANYAWEFNLVKNNEINAFCMPGGKIVVYEGMMNIAKTDEELAVILGHEVAHAVAKHSNERMSQQMMAQYGAQALSIFTSGKSAATQQIANTVYGLGANYAVMLPFSRKHETEADEMGLVLMTMAGYDPMASITVWQRMAASSSSKVPELLSTHPSDQSRIANLSKKAPLVKQQYASYLQPSTPATTTSTTKAATKKTTTKKNTKKTTKKK